MRLAYLLIDRGHRPVRRMQVSLDADSGERRPGSSKSKWIIGVLVVIVIGLAAGLGVTLSSSGGDSCDTVASDSGVPRVRIQPNHDHRIV